LHKFNPHSSRIKGILYLESLKTILTVGEDGKIAVIDENMRSIMNTTKISEYGLTNLVSEEQKKRIFVADKYGSFYILSIVSLPPLLTVKVSTGIKDYIRCIDVDFTKQFIFIASDLGYIKVMQYDSDVTHPKIDEIELISMHEEMRSLLWLTESSLLLIGSRKGLIRFYDVIGKKFMMNFNAHTDSLKQITGNEKRLVTVSKDKSMALW